MIKKSGSPLFFIGFYIFIAWAYKKQSKRLPSLQNLYVYFTEIRV